MPEDTRRSRPDNPLTDLLADYRDLGVAVLYLSPRKSERNEGEEKISLKVNRAAGDATAGNAPPVKAAAPDSFTFEENAPYPAAAKSPGNGQASDLRSLAKKVSSCVACRLCKTRKQTVFADGSPDAKIMFIGEAPGADEDAQGVPFVGRAGQLLTRMIEDGMGLPRTSVYIANVLKCRRPTTATPSRTRSRPAAAIWRRRSTS